LKGVKVTYSGNSEGIVGKVFPRRDGTWIEAVSARYDRAKDRTTVHWRKVDRDDQRSVAPDEFGELRVVDE